jgi:cell cycle protein kinase DBF2
MGRPGTPSQEAFTSPQQTPQGSPSKHHQPPGAFDLPHVFENAMRLLPTMGGSPSKSKPGSPTSPNKAKLQGGDDADPFAHDVTTLTPGSPTRRSNQENTPPNGRPGLQKESSYLTHAAQSRQEPYRTHTADQSTRYYPGPQRLSAEDLEKARKPSVKRLANVTQLCKCGEPMDLITSNTPPDFLDYYYDLLTYVHTRQNRLSQFKAQNPPPPATQETEYNDALTQYLGRERANLRKRRTRLRQGDFQILTQVGQGGYGQVYLAQKKDTKEVCALKVMSKKLLFKLDEIRHVLTERDILTTAKSEWLVRLLYAFQDDKSIYLAMVRRTFASFTRTLTHVRNTFLEGTSAHC